MIRDFASAVTRLREVAEALETLAASAVESEVPTLPPAALASLSTGLLIAQDCCDRARRSYARMVDA